MPVEQVTGERRALAEQGREPGRRPPLPPWAPLLWLLAGAALLCFVVVVLVRPPGPLDDPRVAFQRDGLLLDGRVVPSDVAGVAFGDRPVVLLFERRPPGPAALAAWARQVPDAARTLLVLPTPTSEDLPLETVVDPLNGLAEAVGMPVPVDGGRPVGYAVVDSSRTVRYATLDPEWAGNAFEVGTIAGAVS